MTITKRHYKTLLIEIGNAITHGLGAALAIAGLVVLIVHAALHPQAQRHADHYFCYLWQYHGSLLFSVNFIPFAHFHASQTRISGF